MSSFHYRPPLFAGILAAVLFGTVPARSQDIPAVYLEQARARNLVLQEKKISLEKSLVSLREARSLFQPTTWLEGQYTLSKGGRAIEIPVGDLVNPIYKTLNELTGSNAFRPIGNVSEQLNPNNFYDLRIRTVMPLVQPDLRYNRSIQELQVTLRENEVQTYHRQLVKEVKHAYYQYCAAEEAIRIHRNALQVVEENLRVNRSLLANGKGLPAYIARAESEVVQVESRLQAALSDRSNAKAYFNFLLNQPLQDSIMHEVTTGKELPPSLATLTEADISRREELKTLSLAAAINRQSQKMNESFRIPRVNAFLDLASQGFDFRVNDQSFYYLGGIQFKVPIFTGKRNLYKVEQSRLDARSIALQDTLTREQLQLAAMTSRNNLVTAVSRYHSARKQESASQQYFKLIDRGYREGVNSFIEFLDARNQLTNAELQASIQYYQVLSALAEHERQTATYPIHP